MGEVVLFEPDMLFSSRIESVATRFGLVVKVAVTVGELERALRESVPKLLLVDLDALTNGGVSSLGSVYIGCRRVGYYSHADSKLAAQALACGFEMVMPRRAFKVQLNKILADLGSG